MWYNIFLFELNYRLKRPETYFFFLFLFLFSLVGVEFVFQGVELGMVKKNAPIVIAKTMGAITGLSMIIASMIMGVPVLRDFRYEIAALIYVNPITKRAYLLGRFLGSLVILIIIFSGVLWGMLASELMPWVNPQEYLAFRFINYLQPFLWIALPIVVFGAAVFFVTGALSKKMMVVYTQGIGLFVIFILTKAITHESFQAIFDPFSLSTLSTITKHWTPSELNGSLIPVNSLLLKNKLFWALLSFIILAFGFAKFQLTILTTKSSRKKQNHSLKPDLIVFDDFKIGLVSTPEYSIKAKYYQFFLIARFHTHAILKEVSFWAIVVCGFVIILINSLNLGTVYGVDSYPTTYLIIEELQEMSIYFFVLILLFYSGEIIWKEKDLGMHFIHDATPITNFVNLSSKCFSLLVIYAILMLSLIAAGVLFQALNGYCRFELEVYLGGFFLEIFPFLLLYTMAAIFFQILTGNKFMGILATLVFFIINIAIVIFGMEHVLLNFGGNALASYSDMNGYGHFLKPYLWIKAYWILFGFLLLLVTSVLLERGTEVRLKKRWQRSCRSINKPLMILGLIGLILFLGIGSFIFYHTNVLNEFWTKQEQQSFRIAYEKNLKHLEYIPQPKIIATTLKVELYPSKRGYEVEGNYILTNPYAIPIEEIHVQKYLDAQVQLEDISFDQRTFINTKYKPFDYTIYTLTQPLIPGDSIIMSFKQILTATAFEIDDSSTKVIQNGTFFDNTEFPTFGYNRKYELQDNNTRKHFGLPNRTHKAKRVDTRELVNARTGSDSDSIRLDCICLLYTSQSPRDQRGSRMPSSA